ncbi:MAG: type III-B CRISPR module RAMP protein Cmr4 [Gammaproteobacteria bacterium]|nr:type III-B CRISPR module RAMP protein Cmr4 [Gammaproteobacteria bacterium]
MKSLLLKLHTQTAMHAGSGQADSVIDLPIQRESHTGYPCVFGSSVKGALRTHAETRTNLGENTVAQLFGKEGNSDDGNAGAVLVSDARLLLLPMRSLTGQFRWVTCPAILNRLVQDSKRFGNEITAPIPTVANEEVITASNETVSNENALYLEEYRFTKAASQLDTAWVAILANFLSYDNGQEMLTNQLAIINDEDFAYLAKYTLPVNPHIAIETATKITKKGALWYEEYLPSDTVLYIGISIEDERKKDGAKADELSQYFMQLFVDSQWLQMGGNETVGMGWCSVKLSNMEA